MENRRGENHRAWAWYQCPGFNTRMSELHISLERKVNMAVQYEFTETVNNHYQIITIVLVFFLPVAAHLRVVPCPVLPEEPAQVNFAPAVSAIVQFWNLMQLLYCTARQH